MTHARRRLALVSVLVLTLSVGSIAPAAGQSGQGQQGLQDGWAVNNAGQWSKPDLAAAQFVHMQSAGAGWVRINFRLGACFTDWTSAGCSTGEYVPGGERTALAVYDQVVTRARAHNLRVVGLISNESWKGNQSQWTNGAAETSNGRNNGDNRYVRDFASKAAGVLARHFNGANGPLVDHWEVWNEPNAFTTPRGWTGKAVGGSYLYPSNFAWLLKHSYEAIKAANGQAVVISGGLFSHDRDAGESYLRQTISHGMKPGIWTAVPFDAVGQHLYIDQGGSTSDRNLTRATDSVRRAYTDLLPRGSGIQTWVTEVGWRTGSGGVSLQVQAENLKIAYQTLRGTTYVARTFWFKTRDLPNDGEPYGLLDALGAPKTAYGMYQTYAR